MNKARLYSTLTGLVDQLVGSTLLGTQVIRWSAPVPAFGDPTQARVATLGLNPSPREFLDGAGRELQGSARRFHTLGSLGLNGWGEADVRHLELMLQSCHQYFQRNPYDLWFRKLDRLLIGTGASYYAASSHSAAEQCGLACHLDIAPYATRRKWAELTPAQRSRLLGRSGDALGRLLRDSSIRVLVLNGQSVVTCFERLSTTQLDREEHANWTLPRQVAPVQGMGYRGVVDTICGVELERELLVLGYNHNIQSSFGVTTEVMASIADWLGIAATEWLE